MGTPQPFTDTRLVVAALYAAGDFDLAEGDDPVRLALESRFGQADLARGDLPFVWTTYYADELGDSIIRAFLSFPALVDPSTLASIKAATNQVEEQFLREGRRSVNLDPGLLSLGGFVLATTKGRSHRIALSRGIYGELTLLYENGAFRALPWTYPDWGSAEYAKLLLELRDRLKQALRTQSGTPGSG